MQLVMTWADESKKTGGARSRQHTALLPEYTSRSPAGVWLNLIAFILILVIVGVVGQKSLQRRSRRSGGSSCGGSGCHRSSRLAPEEAKAA